MTPYLKREEASSLIFQQDASSLSSRYGHRTFLTEVLKRGNPRCLSRQISDAKREEVHQLMKQGTFKLILKEDIHPNANVLSARFLLSMKSTIHNKTKWKARDVAGGHREKLKKLQVHTSQSAKPPSVSLGSAVAAAYGFKMWSSDVNRA